MKSQPSYSIASLVLAGSLALTACASSTSSSSKPQMSEEEAMAKMMELATPGPEHQALMKMQGTWDQIYKMRWAPDQPWQETTGTAVAKPILGGRYIQEDVKFTVMGMPMEGMNILGYDNMNGEYTSIWGDSMSTWTVTSRGKADKNGKITMKGTMSDIAGTRPFRMIITPQGDRASNVEMYDTIDGNEILVMTIDGKKR